MGSELLCLALRPGMKGFGHGFEVQGVEAIAYIDYASHVLMGLPAYTVKAFAYLRRELEELEVVGNPAKTVALPPNEYAPKVEESSFLESVDASIAGQGGATVGGLPIGTGPYVI